MRASGSGTGIKLDAQRKRERYGDVREVELELAGNVTWSSDFPGKVNNQQGLIIKDATNRFEYGEVQP